MEEKITNCRLSIPGSVFTINSTITPVLPVNSTIVRRNLTFTIMMDYTIQSPARTKLKNAAYAVEDVILHYDAGSWSNSLLVWISANALDMLVTWQALLLGAREANPLLAAVLSQYGDAAMFAVKITLALLGGLIIWSYGTTRMKGLLNLGMACVVITNCTMLFMPMWQMKTALI